MNQRGPVLLRDVPRGSYPAHPPETMKAALVRAPMDYRVVEVPAPRCPPGGMLVKVHACGLCGSDLRTLRSGHHRVTLPFIVGHEISGTVVETGPAFTGPWRAGQMLSVAPLVYCGACEFCVDGRFELCDGYREIAQAWPGGFAEYLAVPEEAVARGTIRRVPEGLDPAVAAIAEPVSSCVHAQEAGRIGPGDTVAVLGAGPVGCIHVALARARGAARIIVGDINAARLGLCARFSPDHLVDLREKGLVDEVMRVTRGRGADCIITANPAPESQVEALRIARKGGRILLFGGLPPEKARPGIDTNLIHYNALQLIGTTIFAPRHHAAALGLLADGSVDGAKLITHRLPLSDFVEGARMALAGEVLKCVFLP